ncbi:MAG: prepilin-type N-terminal cleavage/methylation domain-containing protein [Deltaproteobacteria bacterium]|nr:prepilin-type N-terminal cleavage/methylation domain-containing protein [Deltaproteobacteria bacterium]
MTPLCKHNSNQGFTLIEILVVMALGLVVLGAVLSIFIKQNETSTAQQEITYAQQNVRAAMDLMVREIRNAGYDPQRNDFDAIKTAKGDELRILSNLDGDDEAGHDPDDANEDVTYSVNAFFQLERNGNILVNSPCGLAFGYVLADGTVHDPPAPGDPPLDLSNIGGADQRDEVRAVIIFVAVMTANPAPDTGEYRMRPLMNAVRIRNLGFKDIE